MKEVIQTKAAPAAIGPYSQAIKVNTTVYFSGQIPLCPSSMQLISNDFKAQAEQVMKNLSSVAEASSGGLDKIVKLTIFLTDLKHFTLLNEVMTRYFKAPYPARSTIQVSALPKEAQVEIEAVMVLD